MKKYRIIEKRFNDKSVHYIECNTCKQISPFAVQIEDQYTIIFMDEIISVEESKLNIDIQIGDKVQIKNGATEWMKKHNYWLEDMGTSIDGYIGEVIDDYTHLAGSDSHFGINIGFNFVVGVNPMWVRLV